jgi:uncharacterized phage protein (TIGR02218 family)
MRNLSPHMQAALSRGATTLCTCWRLTRSDGIITGFTDHDCDIAFDGGNYTAMSGLVSTAFESSAGLAIGGAEVSGALSAQSLSESDLYNGLFDNARVDIFRVDWSAPENHVLLETGVIGEVRRSEHAFTAELRSLAHELDQERGRLYHAGCDADLGDMRCRFSSAAEPFVIERVVLSGSDAASLKMALGDLQDGWLDGGSVEILSGRNAGARVSVRAHRRGADAHVINLWTRLASAVATGDRVRVHAGCDKSFETCRVKFSNSVNFRGFPHMPGNDHLMSYGKRGVGMDGGSLLR